MLMYAYELRNIDGIGLCFAASTGQGRESKTEPRTGDRVRRIPIGAQGSFTLLVPQRLASRFKDTMLPDVLATPVLVMVIENAALAALEPYLEPGETAVGTCVDIRHLAPTLIGMRVFGEASVTRVEGRQVQFHVRAVDEGGQIGAGSHERMVVDAARTVRDEATGCEGCEVSSYITRSRARHAPNKRRSTCFTVDLPSSRRLASARSPSGRCRPAFRTLSRTDTDTP
jgi:fluoroacetyl-CoA thioesterase